MGFLSPLLLVGLGALAIPVLVHLIERERKDLVPFPSLMFLQRIPYQSVERRRINHWLLFLLRAVAMALVVAAFARPFLTESAVTAAASITGARDVVILLDRSASMGYGNHWARAQQEARRIVAGLGGQDRATLVLFDRGVEEAVRATSNRGELDAAIGQAAVSGDLTRYAPALREAQSLLGRSDRARREAYLISDFQRSGWERQEDIHLPPGATITPVSVAELETSDLAVTSLALPRTSFSGQERVTITAAITNHSASTLTSHPVRLEIDGRTVETKPVTIGPHASGSVTFDALTVGEPNMRGVIRTGSDALPKDNDFYFVLSPSRPVSVLVVQGDGAAAGASLYLTTVLGLSRTPPFAADVVAASKLTPAMLDGRSVVVLNDSTALSSEAAARIRTFVERGGGLFVALGARTPVAGDWPLLPGALGSPIDRAGAHGGALGTLDFSHPVFEQFKEQGNGNFANMRFYRYRSLAAGPDDRVLARYDDGATAMAERRVGSGRVIAFTSTIDGSWNDFPTTPMFLPLMHEAVKYLAQYGDVPAWETVGHMFDISSAVSSIVRAGEASTPAGAAGGGTGIVVSPSGKQVTLGGAGRLPAAELTEQGFYSVRLPGMRDRRPYTVAVNLDPAESDLSALAPAEFLASVAGRQATPAAAAATSLEHPEITPVDIEKRQSLWWFLLAAGIAPLLVESALSNRLSKGQAARRAVGRPV
jgi:hypothetical protein